MPSPIAVESGQGKKRLVSPKGPELAGEFEPVLILRTGRFDGAGTAWLPKRLRRLVVHPVLVLGQISDFASDGGTPAFVEPVEFALQILETLDHIQGSVFPAFKPAQVGAQPLLRLGCALSMHSAARSHRCCLI